MHSMEFIPLDLSKYAEDHTTEESVLLQKINRETHLDVLKPRMLSGHLQGRFLSLVSKMMQPKRILEIGTYTGYSAISMAEGLADDGLLYTIDVNEELKPRVLSYFAASPFSSKIKFLIGEADEIIKDLEEEWDIIFIDADKVNYLNYYEKLVPTLRRGGVIIADNVLWSGKISDPAIKDKTTQSLRAFNQAVQQDDRVENVLLPVRDGLMMVRKK